GPQDVPDLVLEVGRVRGRFGRRSHGLLAERVGVLARDAEEAAVGGGLHRVRSAERLRDHHVRALLERHRVAEGNLYGLAVTRELDSLHVDLLPSHCGTMLQAAQGEGWRAPSRL